MEAHELMIGNYYTYASNNGILYRKVEAIQCNEFGLLSNIDGTNFEICKPIPLTEEWLLRFGFEYFEGWDNMIFYREKNWQEKNECFELYKTLQGFIFDNFRSLNIKHVHQLQNLYFALTGTQLILKE